MSLFELCIRRPVLSTVLSLLVLVIGADLVFAARGARVPEDRRAGGQRIDRLSRRVGRRDRVADHQGARGLAGRHRRRRVDDVVQPRRAQQHQRPLPHHARSGFGCGRRARQGGARARTAAGQRRRAGDREGRSRFVPDHLDGGDGRRPHAARGIGLSEPLRQAAPVGAAGRGRRLDLRRAQDVDAHQRRPRPARRLPPDAAATSRTRCAGRTSSCRRVASNRPSASSRSSRRPMSARASSSKT